MNDLVVINSNLFVIIVSGINCSTTTPVTLEQQIVVKDVVLK